jgi:3-oxoacyl-[acyl-carrier protein] reductase
MSGGHVTVAATWSVRSRSRASLRSSWSVRSVRGTQLPVAIGTASRSASAAPRLAPRRTARSVASVAVDLGLDGKVALVTAASRGLGFATAKALVEEGARVTICARDPERLRAAAAELGPDVLAVPADVTDPEAPARLVGATVERFGALHVLVANAGGPPNARAVDVDDDTLRVALEANLLTSVRLVREALPHLRAAGWGRICLITSSSVKQPIPDLATSTTARAGLWGWAKTAAIELAGEGITLNLACPGLHRTARVREARLEGRMGEPEDFGKVVAFLCSEPAGFISGAAVSVDGAGTLGLL